MRALPRLILLSLLAAASAHAAPLSKADPLTWPRASVGDFGCFLERAFAFKDKKFNCKLRGYKPASNPSSPRYDEGPEFPPGKAESLHPLIAEVHLSWEHGELREVELRLSKKLTRAEAEGALHLPKESALPQNVMSIDVQECAKDRTCVVLTGFDHQGGGD